MYDTETRTRFIELRAKGWSIKRVADRLKVAPRTLVDWNRQDKESIRTMRAVELEALQEKILASREQELQSLKHSLDLIQEQIAARSHQYTSLENLYRLAALVRAEIRKVCQTPDFSDPTFTEEPESRSPAATKQAIPRTSSEIVPGNANPSPPQNLSSAATGPFSNSGPAPNPSPNGPSQPGLDVQTMD